MYLQKMEKGSKEWIDLDQDKDSWQAPVYTFMFYKMQGIS
jgi:hypothetical protein